MESYRLGLYAIECGWGDVSLLERRYATSHIAPQLYRALGSISANLTEGFSRGTVRDRVRFYEYTLSSTRESKVWYYSARPILGASVVDERQGRLEEIRKLVLGTMRNERRGGRDFRDG
jgi:four helix bundle protein